MTPLWFWKDGDEVTIYYQAGKYSFLSPAFSESISVYHRRFPSRITIRLQGTCISITGNITLD